MHLKGISKQNINRILSRNSVSHLGTSPNGASWWQLTFHSYFTINKILLYPGSENNLHGVIVLIDGEVVGEVAGEEGGVQEIVADGKRGQYMIICSTLFVTFCSQL